ncbi:MAG: hypothetical protein F8N37_01700 [Telmatospirillum sp.]|nr:hypothetical protein [Telmatospirillum sp.]
MHETLHERKASLFLMLKRRSGLSALACHETPLFVSMHQECANIAWEGYLRNQPVDQIVVQERKRLAGEKWREVCTTENPLDPHFIR